MARWDRAAAPAAVLLVVAVVFVLLRTVVAGSGHLGSFVYAGTDFAHPPLPGVPIHPGPGYDGQFSYRLAVDPAALGETAGNIRLDTTLRLERIAYPALVWLVSAGQRSAVPVGLVVVNLLALATLGFLGGVLARQSGRNALWGLLLAGYWGYLFSLGRDLHEIVTGACVLGALLAYRSARPYLSAAVLSVAVLARETALLVVVAIALVRLADLLRRRTRIGPADCCWIVPALVFVGWQAVCWAVVGSAPTLAGGPDQVGPPVVALVGAIRDAIGGLGGGHRAAAALLVVQLAAFVIVVAFAATRLRTSSIPRHERLAWVLALLLTLSLSRHFWSGPADLRALSDLYLLSAVLLLSGPRRSVATGERRLLLFAAAPAAATFAVTFLARVVEL